MPNIDFTTPAAGFDQPLQLWQACHERIQRMVGLLQRLAQHLAAHGADDAAQTTATSIIRYFDDAAPLHHEDEEKDLFPRLLERLERAPAAARTRAQETIGALRQDHEHLERQWRLLREQLLGIEAGATTQLLPGAVKEFAQRYQQHIADEDGILAPLFARWLRPADLLAIGHAMALRRGVDLKEIQPRPARRPAAPR